MTHERGNPLAFRSPLMLDDFELGSERSRDWSAALVQHAVAQRPMQSCSSNGARIGTGHRT